MKSLATTRPRQPRRRASDHRFPGDPSQRLIQRCVVPTGIGQQLPSRQDGKQHPADRRGVEQAGITLETRADTNAAYRHQQPR